MKRKIGFLLCAILLVCLAGYKKASEDHNDHDTVSYTIISTTETTAAETETAYIVNINTGKFHCPDCPSIDQMSENNKRKYVGDRDDLISNGYTPCKRCEP